MAKTRDRARIMQLAIRSLAKRLEEKTEQKSVKNPFNPAKKYKFGENKRMCLDIGMFALDRPTSSCNWRTAFCSKLCFNNKFYEQYPVALVNKDCKSEQGWQSMTYEEIDKMLASVRRTTAVARKYSKPDKVKGTKRKLIAEMPMAKDRFRLMSRGEAFATIDDIATVEKIFKAAEKHGVKVWVPTRSWRSAELKNMVRALQLMYPKTARIMASTDPETIHLTDALLEEGWSVIFFGDDEVKDKRYVKCPKTWEHKLGHCGHGCNYCFGSKQIIVHLKTH